MKNQTQLNQPLAEPFIVKLRERLLKLSRRATPRSRKHKTQDIEDAINRMDKGVYGICENCGKPISELRLQSTPETRLCAQCDVPGMNHAYDWSNDCDVKEQNAQFIWKFERSKK